MQREGRRHEPTQAHHQTSQAPATKLPKLTHLHRILFLFLIVLTPQAHAQGCTQCLDSTRATPPQVQAAYRHAILLLGGTAASLFLAGALLLRKTAKRHPAEAQPSSKTPYNTIILPGP